MTVSRKDSCDARIGSHLDSRLGHIGALQTLMDVQSMEDLHDIVNADAHVSSAYDDIEVGHVEDVDEIRDMALEQLYQLPLAISSQTVSRIELSTGGPADWLEVFWTPASDCEPAEITRIVYHFADWFDHAERPLDGEQFDVARQFAEQMIDALA